MVSYIFCLYWRIHFSVGMLRFRQQQIACWYTLEKTDCFSLAAASLQLSSPQVLYFKEIDWHWKSTMIPSHFYNPTSTNTPWKVSESQKQLQHYLSYDEALYISFLSNEVMNLGYIFLHAFLYFQIFFSEGKSHP